MGSIISAILDDYECYEALCKIAGVEPLAIRGEKSFFQHAKEVKQSLTDKQREQAEQYYWYNHF